MSTAIQIANLTKEFPALAGGRSARAKAVDAQTRAVDRVSLTIPPGELFFLLGPSGCGKTTLLRMIAGFIEPTDGQILFNGRDVTYTAPNDRNTGMVFQSYALWPHMSVAQNVAFGLEVRRTDAATRQRLVAEALAAVRMEDFASRRPNQLSGGQQQRVALARALVIRPDVLLLDEPLSNLDAKLRIELRTEIRRVCKQSGITTIYVTHDQKEALSMADRIAIMEKGRAVQVGAPGELYRRPGSRFVAEFLGETNILPAEVLSTHSGFVEVRTGAGTLRAAAVGAPPAPGTRALLSIRPEAIGLDAASGQPSLPGTVREQVYLGEIAQYTIVLPDGTPLRASALNPPAADFLAPGAQAGWRVDPADVVLLPA